MVIGKALSDPLCHSTYIDSVRNSHFGIGHCPGRDGGRGGRCRRARAEVGLDAAPGATATDPTRPNRLVLPLAQPIEASLAKPDLNAPTSVSISASVIGVENVHAPVLM